MRSNILFPFSFCRVVAVLIDPPPPLLLLLMNSYLHNGGMSHRNLTSLSVIVDGLGVPKITNYGLGRCLTPVRSAKPLRSDIPSSAAALDEGLRPPLWMAPEVLAAWDPAALNGAPEGGIAGRDAPLSFGLPRAHEGKEADVYSFAVVLWELLVCRVPWYDIPADDSTALARVVASAVVGGRRPAIPTRYSRHAAAKLIRRCWVQDPAQRPTFTDIVASVASSSFDDDGGSDDALLPSPMPSPKPSPKTPAEAVVAPTTRSEAELMLSTSPTPTPSPQKTPTIYE
jgi:hypothetical protein